MTIDAFTQAAEFLIQGIGPYQIPHPYIEGAITASVVVDDLPVALVSGDDFTVDPVSSTEQGNLYLSAEAAATHAGRALWIDRQTEPLQNWEARLGDREVGMEAQLDRDAMALQEVRRGMLSALRGRRPVLPYDPQPGHVPVARADGLGFENGPTLTEIAGAKIFSDLAQQAAADTEQYRQDMLSMAWHVRSYQYAATAGQTVFSGADQNGSVLEVSAEPMVIHEGSTVPPSNFTVAPDGDAITLSYAADAGDVVVIHASAVAPLADYGVVRNVGARSVLVSLTAAGAFDGYADGAEVVAGALRYRRAFGAVVLPGLPGWLPAGPPYIDHASPGGDAAPAIAALAAWIGQGEIHGLPGVNYLIDSNVTLPIGVKLVGPHRGGFGLPGLNNAAPYKDVAGKLIVNSAATITVDHCAGVSGWVIHRKGIEFTDAAPYLRSDDDFAGTALTVVGGDFLIEGNLIFGFERAVDGTNAHRGIIRGNRADCINGVRIDDTTDCVYLSDNHCWPFSTIEAVANADTPNIPGEHWKELNRSGIAFDIVQADWANLTNCFAYGYLTGFDIAANTAAVVGCGADGTGSASPMPGTKGFVITGTRATLTNCRAAGQADHGVYFGGATNSLTASVIGCSFHGLGKAGIAIDGSREVVVGGNLFSDMSDGIRVMTSTARVTDSGGNNFINIAGEEWRADVQTSNVQIGSLKSNKTPAGRPISANFVLPNIASASPLNLPSTGDRFIVTGTTNFGSINGYWPGRQVTLLFSGALQVFSSASGANTVRLDGSATFGVVAGSSLTLMHNGTQWIEIGRSA